MAERTKQSPQGFQSEREICVLCLSSTCKENTECRSCRRERRQNRIPLLSDSIRVEIGRGYFWRCYQCVRLSSSLHDHTHTHCSLGNIIDVNGYERIWMLCGELCNSICLPFFSFVFLVGIYSIWFYDKADCQRIAQLMVQ